VEKVYQQLLIPGVTRAFSDFQNAELTWDGLKCRLHGSIGRNFSKNIDHPWRKGYPGASGSLPGSTWIDTGFRDEDHGGLWSLAATGQSGGV